MRLILYLSLTLSGLSMGYGAAVENWLLINLGGAMVLMSFIALAYLDGMRII